MKKFSLDFLRLSGAVFFSVIVCLVLGVMGCGVYTFVKETSVRLPFNLVEFLYQKTTSGGFDIEIIFIENFIWYIMITILCISLIVAALKYMVLTKNPLYILLIILSIFIVIWSKNSLVQIDPFKDISESGINQLLQKNERAIIYIGRDTCPDCIRYKPKLTSFLKKEKKQIRYFDVSGSEQQISEYRTYYNKLGIKGVPAVFKIENGQVTAIYYGDKTPGKIEKEILKF